MNQKYVYSLGGGCYVNSDIPDEIKLDSIFKSVLAEKNDVFLPLQLFNGNLENEFLHKDGNWSIDNINDNFDAKRIQQEKKQNEAYVSNYLVTYDIVNKNIGWTIKHPCTWKNNPTNKWTFKPLFESFNKNKYNLVYIIDFQRAGYELYENYQLLEFEKYLVEDNYDLKNFIYLDVDAANDKERFNDCKIQHFIQNTNDPSGFGYETSPNAFRNTRCFFANHMDYVKKLLDS